MPTARAAKIKIVFLDVDGVMTDGTIWLLPAPPGARQAMKEEISKHADGGGYSVSSDTIIEAKGFHAHDGTAISLARLGGLKTGIITKRISETVALRARDLKVDHVRQGVADKLGAFRAILKEEGLTEEQAAYVGDDIIDLPVMQHCGLAIAVADARREIKDIAHFVTEHGGGKGAVRDAIEFILRTQGKLDQVIDKYLDVRKSERDA